jgi:hypothetical protein
MKKPIKYTIEIEWGLNSLLEYGDLIFAEGLDLIEVSREIRKLDIIPLAFIRNNPFNALGDLGFNEIVTKIKAAAKYECPMTHNIYYGTLPVAIATSDKKQYTKLTEYHLDTDWHRRSWGDHLFVPNLVERSIMGHGYTFVTLPSDGCHTLTLAAMKIPNNNYLICLTYVWHNK